MSPGLWTCNTHTGYNGKRGCPLISSYTHLIFLVVMNLHGTSFINSLPARSGYASNPLEDKVLDQTLSDASTSCSDSILWWRRVNGLRIPSPPQPLPFEILGNVSTGDTIHTISMFHFSRTKTFYTANAQSRP
jgi:hypothetical protein